MTAVIVGATGLVGRWALKMLLASPALTGVVSVGRRPVGLNHPRLEELFLPHLEDLSEMANRLKGDFYFCALGTTLKAARSQKAFEAVDLGAVVAFAKIAKQHQARSLAVVSATGANTESWFYYNRVKGQMEKQLEALHLASLVLVQPALLMGAREHSRPLETVAQTVLKPLVKLCPSPWTASMASPAEDVAAVLVREGLLAKPGVWRWAPRELRA